MKTEKEIRDNFKIFIGEKEIINLICFKMEENPEDNTYMIDLIRGDLFKIFDENFQKRYRILVDMLPIGKINSYGFSSQTRKIGAQIMSHKQFEKGALITPSLFVRTAVAFIIAAAGKKDFIRIFSKEEEALKWLKEE
jgi:hypothetical protein